MKRKIETTIGEGLTTIGEGLINPRTGQSAHAFHTKVARWVPQDAPGVFVSVDHVLGLLGPNLNHN